LVEISPFSREVHSSTQGGWLTSDGEASWDGAPKRRVSRVEKTENYLKKSYSIMVVANTFVMKVSDSGFIV
jgi:hypothetical protein